MDEWIELRRKIPNEEVPLRQLERETGIGRQTLRKIRDNSQPPGYQRTKPVEKPKIGRVEQVTPEMTAPMRR